MILPESLYLFPLLLQGILKTPLFTRDSYGLFGYRTDDKAALLHTMNVVSTSTVSAMAYPTVLPLFPLYDYPDAGVRFRTLFPPAPKKNSLRADHAQLPNVVRSLGVYCEVLIVACGFLLSLPSFALCVPVDGMDAFGRDDLGLFNLAYDRYIRRMRMG